jgi:hypothetical protein
MPRKRIDLEPSSLHPKREMVTWNRTGHICEVVDMDLEPNFKPEDAGTNAAVFKVTYSDIEDFFAEPSKIKYFILLHEDPANSGFSTDILFRIMQEMPPVDSGMSDECATPFTKSIFEPDLHVSEDLSQCKLF